MNHPVAIFIFANPNNTGDFYFPTAGVAADEEHQQTRQPPRVNWFTATLLIEITEIINSTHFDRAHIFIFKY